MKEDVLDQRAADVSAAPAREVQVTAHAIEALYRSLPSVLPNLSVMAIVLGAAMWNYVDRVVLVVWMVAWFALIGVRFALFRAYDKRRPQATEAQRWARHITVISLLGGFVWGAAGMLFFVADSVGLQLFLYLSVIGMAAGSIVVYRYWLPAYYASVVPAVAMCAVRLAYEGTLRYQIYAVLSLAALAIVMRIARRQKGMAYDAIALRFENQELVKQLREQKDIAERANVAKSKFLAAASHDLRQPLHALGLFVAALSEPSSRADRDVVHSIERSLRALDGLFDALLDISKLDAGMVNPEIQHVMLAPLLERLAAEYEPQARAKGLAWRYSATETAARTDIVLLETVLRNLIGNAIRYTEAGEVRLSCVQAEGTIRIEVADTGIGIPREQQGEVFREFVQLHNPERDRTKGLGLGLAIVDRLTKLLDHPLQMTSAPGEGSAFVLELPLGDVIAAKRMLDEAPESPLLEEAPLRVLVVEDEVDARQALVTLLQKWGHEVVAVASPQEAVAISGPAPHTIIADHRLREGETGGETIRRVQQAWGRAIPALIVTGDTGSDGLHQAQQSGFTLLHKPVSPGKLRAFLRGVQRERAQPAAELAS